MSDDLKRKPKPMLIDKELDWNMVSIKPISAEEAYIKGWNEAVEACTDKFRSTWRKMLDDKDSPFRGVQLRDAMAALKKPESEEGGG